MTIDFSWSTEDWIKLIKDFFEIIQNFFKEIGISNVHKRLKYEFGEQYGLFIESKEGRYTKIRVLISERRTDV